MGMKGFYKIIIVFFFGLFAFSNQAEASHVAGADFSYTCVGPNTFLVTLNIFRDCSGISAPTSAAVTFTSSCGGAVNVTLTLQNPPIGTEVSQLCAAQISNSTCNGGSLPGMQQYIYSDLVVLAPTCNIWSMAWSTCCRNSPIVNMTGGGMYIPASLNNAVDSCNNSPQFNAQPIPYVCQNQLVNYNFGVIEPDGDSLVFSLVPPILSSVGGVPTNGTHIPPYSAGTPLVGAVLNPTTGQLIFTPTTQGFFVVAVMVCEYEYGTGILKGCVTRDIQFVVIPCSNVSPTWGGIQNFSGNGILVDSTTIEVCVGNAFSFDLLFPDPDTADIVTLFTNITTILPGATVIMTPGNPATMNVTWTTSSGTAPFNSFSVTAIDDACPTFGLVSTSYVIKVTASTYAGQDQAICQGVQWAQLNGVGGTVFNWSVLSGSPIDTVVTSPTYNATCQNCPSPQFSPQQTTTYVLTSNLSTTCQNTDTVTITAAPNYVAFAGPDTVTCSIDSMQLSASASIGGTFTYRWNQILHISDDTIADPWTLPPSTTTYTVTMTSPDGCIKSASATIGKVPPIPVPTALASPQNLCALGDTTDMELDLGPNFTSTCVKSLFPCANNGYTTDILIDYDPATGTSGPISTTTTTSFPTPFGNSVKSAKQQYLYRGTELQAMGLQAGLITEIGFFVTQINGTGVYYNYQMKMGCTPILSIPATIFPTISQTVMTSSTVSLTTGWNMLQFTSPYIWDGSSNLMLEICFDNRSQGAPTANSQVRVREYKTTTPGGQRVFHSMAIAIDTANACPAQIADITYHSQSRPDTRFTFCFGTDPLAYTYAWSPNYNIDDSTSRTPSAWPDTATTYTVILADTFGVCSDTTEIEITVADFDAGPDTLICAGDTIQLSPVAIDSCSLNSPIMFWFSSNGIGVVGINGIVPTVSVTTTTTFYGSYTNFCGCVMNDSVTVYVNEMAPPRLTFTEPACGQSDGFILVQDSGGLSPFTYSIDGGATFHVDSLFGNLAMGPYTTQYMDSLGCLSPTRMDTLINFFTPSIDSVVTNTPLCFSTASGQIDIYATGGTLPRTYSLDGGLTWSLNSSHSNLLAGTYVILVRDSNLCVSYPDTAILAANNQLFFDSAIVTDLNCYQDSSGTIQMFGHGGTNPYTFSIDSGTVYQASNTFTGLHAGTYSLIIMDSVGCTTIPAPYIVNDAAPIVVTVTPVNDTCYNACGGLVTTTISGGTAPYSYSWRKGINPIGTNNSSITGLCAGTDYELTILDSNNCQQIFPFAITQPDILVASSTTTPASCYGTDDGTITISAVGGVAPYKYSVNGGASFSTNPTFTGLASGVYSIMVADSGYRCSHTITDTILTPDPIITTTNITQKTICVSGCTPLIANATGGIGAPYNYIWNNGFSTSNAQTACPTQTTIYSVYAVDSIGCTSPAVLITLDLYDSLTVEAGANLDLCPGEPGQLNAIASGGNGGTINYQWTPVNGLSGGFISNPIATPQSTMTYTVKVTDNCETPPAYDTVQVVIHPNPTMGFDAADTTSGCEPFDITLVNSSNPVQFAEWTIGDDITAHGFQIDVTDLMEGIYDVKLRVVTPFGCENELTKSKFITVFPKPVAKFDMDPENTTVYNTIVQFEDKSIGDIQTWEWDFAGLGNSADADPLYKFPADTGTYEITLKVTTVKLCEDETTELLKIGGEYNIFVPNSFTPNGDGQNDVFAPRAIGVDGSQYSLMIYDRWGGIIFESTDLNQPWDGRVQGTTKMAQNGVYVWKIVAHDTTSESEGHTYHGTVNLIR